MIARFKRLSRGATAGVALVVGVAIAIGIAQGLALTRLGGGGSSAPPALVSASARAQARLRWIGLPGRAPVAVELPIVLAIESEHKVQGLSGVRPAEWNPAWGMLFVYPSVGSRGFWMPDTYFDLHIVFLDRSLTIVGLERNVPAHPGWAEPPAIARTAAYRSQHVLELMSDSEIARQVGAVGIGGKFEWVGESAFESVVMRASD